MTITTPCYAWREDIKTVLDYKETARANTQIDNALQSASRSIEDICHRRFYPEIATRYFPWPNYQRARPWRLWLDENELISVSALSSGGTTIAASDYFLEPVNSGPPYASIEIDLDSSAAFGGSTTFQRGVTVTGLFAGARLATAPAGALAEALDSSETAIDVTDSAAVGIGALIAVDSERMLVTGKSALTTGQTVITTALTASAANVAVLVTSGAALSVGEPITIDSERMLIVDITGNTLTVIRAYDGSVLAAHNTGVTIYAGRTLTVIRGALGTTAAAHDTAAAVVVHAYPAPVRTLCVAETVSILLQEHAGWASGAKGSPTEAVLAETAGLPRLRKDVLRGYGRRARSAAV